MKVAMRMLWQEIRFIFVRLGHYAAAKTNCDDDSWLKLAVGAFSFEVCIGAHLARCPDDKLTGETLSRFIDRSVAARSS